LPGRIRENKTYKQWLQQISYAPDYTSRLNAVNSVQLKDLDDIDVQALLRKALSDKLAAIRLAAVNKILKTGKDQQQKQWKGDMALLAMNDGNNQVRAAALYGLGLWKERSQQALMQEAIYDSSYLVAGNALYALNRVAPDTAYLLARRMLGGKPATNLDRHAWSVIAAKAETADTALFRKYAWHPKGGQQDYLMSYIAVYAINTANDRAFRNTLELLSAMIVKVENKTQRANYAAVLTSIHTAMENRVKKDKKDTLSREKMTLLEATVAGLKSAEKEQEVLKVYDAMGK
jgi:hypothetical protein